MKRGVKGLNIDSLPYVREVYVNNQVLIPARLVSRLDMEKWQYAKIIINVKGSPVILPKVKLLRTHNTSSRQFTIPKPIRDALDIKPGDKVKIVGIESPEQV